MVAVDCLPHDRGLREAAGSPTPAAFVWCGAFAVARAFAGQGGGALLHDARARGAAPEVFGRIAQLVEQLTLNKKK